MNCDTAAFRHFDLRNTALTKAFQSQSRFLLNENFTNLNNIAKDTEFFF